ncbi:type II toxin-antitoxin system HicB family antitoxin [Cetobacterium sp. 2A]|uniref:type II toxin-antitoxin system HicB family antitoxin n=1 Tax=Cetobacterium sp. 2A TaxID=2754723 RepID=UPI00163BFD04|nr:type II toxin-antitoxin system HicB family antitoxin [Cetobacterium sp. 2A]MBC2856952.1 type II toxin-antitoxin system HicB family antitoxin [Cetobacterium sp. 2A]
MKTKKYTYPAVFKEDNGDFYITFPDFPDAHIYGKNLEEALFLAEDCLGLYLYSLKIKGLTIPKESNPQNIKIESTDFIQLLEVSIPSIIGTSNNRNIKKSISLSKWLNEFHKKIKLIFLLWLI